jgi:hypothetical protein
MSIGPLCRDLLSLVSSSSASILSRLFLRFFFNFLITSSPDVNADIIAKTEESVLWFAIAVDDEVAVEREGQ